jgi:hypothetical protein
MQELNQDLEELESDYLDDLVSRRLLGKAGEYLVAGKLLLNGFKVYTETVDDGMDLIATKNDNFYYFQVKTCQDTNYDSGTFQARVNLGSFSKFPQDQSYIVFVLHLLGAQTSLDMMGNHNFYEEIYIPIPAKDFMSFFATDDGHISLRLFYSPVMEGEHDFIVSMRVSKKSINLDNYLISSFNQVGVNGNTTT